MPATNEDVDAAAAHSRIVPDLDTHRASFGTILIDPPWRFTNRTGKVAPEHKRLRRYNTMSFDEIAALPVGALAKAKSHLYLWSPNALIYGALQIMQAWGFTYKTNIVWLKVRKDGGSPAGSSPVPSVASAPGLSIDASVHAWRSRQARQCRQNP